jgi:hypothetical protein
MIEQLYDGRATQAFFNDTVETPEKASKELLKAAPNRPPVDIEVYCAASASDQNTILRNYVHSAVSAVTYDSYFISGLVDSFARKPHEHKIRLYDARLHGIGSG